MDQTTQPLARSPLDQPPEDTVGGMDVRIRQKPAVVEQRPENAKDFSATSQEARDPAPKQQPSSTPLKEVEPLRLEPASAVAPY